MSAPVQERRRDPGVTAARGGISSGLFRSARIKPRTWYDYQEYFANRRAETVSDPEEPNGQDSADEPNEVDDEASCHGPALKAAPDYLKQIASCFGVDHEAIAASVDRIFEERRAEREKRKAAKNAAVRRKAERQRAKESAGQGTTEQSAEVN